MPKLAFWRKRYVVQFWWNTDENGIWVANEMDWDKLPSTLHGPFKTQEEADHFQQHFAEDDTDVNDACTRVLTRRDRELFINPPEEVECYCGNNH